MSELFTLLQGYSPVTVIVILVLTFVAAEWIMEKYKKVKAWFLDYRENYHQEENKKEEKEQSINQRINSLEKHRKQDYDRIKSVESNLYELKEQNKQQNIVLAELSDMVVDIKLEHNRARILDFAPKATDLTKPVSKEAYHEVFKIHQDYRELVKKKNRQNDWETWNFDRITESYTQREQLKNFSEDLYIPSMKLDKKKLQENKDNLSK